MQANLRIALVHPDLGIGGAERLVVDAATGLKSLGHTLTIFTSHHDPLHSFKETNDGIFHTSDLTQGSLHIIVKGDWLPRSINGRFMILCASLRSLYLSLYIALTQTYDVYIVDQISMPVLVLALFTSTRILFYCHFPDKLLAKKNGVLKRVYRVPFDAFEEFAIDVIAVNSEFTKSVFQRVFWSIRRMPRVLYPAINLSAFDGVLDTTHASIAPFAGKRFMLSVNRFERKKEVELAIKAFASVSRIYPDMHLFIAGGYDSRVKENEEYLEELMTLSASFSLFPRIFKPTTRDGVDALYPPKIDDCARVIFLPSCTDLQKRYLLKKSVMLVYTPSNEHFGIVPVEGMYAETVVVAVNTGGPVESVGEGCGVLVDASEDGFCEGMVGVLRMSVSEREEMGRKGRKRVVEMFGLERFSSVLDGMIREMAEKGPRQRVWYAIVVLAIILIKVSY